MTMPTPPEATYVQNTARWRPFDMLAAQAMETVHLEPPEAVNGGLLEYALRLGIEITIAHPEWAMAWRARALEDAINLDGMLERATWLVEHVPITEEIPR